ncbi:MAG: NUDIX hydrolase [Chryseobacterium sp.]|uniref:NUDIX hydrolase n=1 Tax=unclassified Chryseobacterium TaxID=2593645 RepID=UPI000DB457F2|nr:MULTISPECIES: NUDIX domain-containing protein [unclassified Chryseobacterium]MPS66810.1 NUDIX hydrolase [Chryseobacterium sp.]PZU21065.1 MAG: NUDIX hydrolase [Chryseobacterium sp.]UMQ43333.1 NUDIX hydrolase [Chryseobacterium sp. Y16C]
MNPHKQILEKSVESYELYLPHISIDTVIFGFSENELKVLAIKMKFNQQWFLPGGYLQKKEHIDDAAVRILSQRAGVTNIFLEEFAVFGKYGRSEDFFADYEDSLWHKQRFVSIGYYALVNYHNVSPKADEMSEEFDWLDVNNLDQYSITMDHKEIIQKALLTLRERITYKPIGYNLLPEKFTMTELQKLYETILGRSLNRGNFYRKIKNMGILTKLNELRTGGAHKAQELYSFDKENYEKALQDGVNSW